MFKHCIDFIKWSTRGQRSPHFSFFELVDPGQHIWLRGISKQATSSKRTRAYFGGTLKEANDLAVCEFINQGRHRVLKDLKANSPCLEKINDVFLRKTRTTEYMSISEPDLVSILSGSVKRSP